MSELNTKDFTNSYKALQNAKYPTQKTNADEHLVLVTILNVSIEWKKSLAEVQELLDKKTKENNAELEFHLAKKISA